MKDHAFAYLHDSERCWHCGHFRSEHMNAQNDGPFEIGDPCRKFIEGKAISDLLRLNFSPAIRISQHQSEKLIEFLAEIERIYARTCPTCVIPAGRSNHATGCTYAALVEAFKV